MDYKTFSKEFEGIKKDILNFTTSKTKKNITRVDKIVNDYLDNIAIEKYSLKSYKAKIIHNELEHHHTSKELIDVVKRTNERLDELLKVYFQDYYDYQLTETSSPTKLKDLKDFSLAHRKERQDTVNKKNSLEKEIILKNKEFDAQKEEKLKLYNENILDIKTKLQSNINKVNDKTIREYSDLENRLLETDDKKEIVVIKKKINEIRLKGLEEEYNLKVQTFDVLDAEERSFIETYESFLKDVKIYNNTNKRSIYEFEKTLNDLTLELDNKEQKYDAETEIKYIEKAISEIDELISLIINYNKIINRYNHEVSSDLSYKEKLFILDFIIMNLYYMLVKIRFNNLYDSLCLIIIDLIDLVKNVKNSSIELFTNMENERLIKEKLLVTALENYIPSNKKVTKEDFINNVTTSLSRYYNNVYNEIEKFNLTIYNFLVKIVKGLIGGHDSLFTNNNQIGIIPKTYLFNNERYNYVDINEFLKGNGSDEVVVNGETFIMTNDHKIENIVNYQNTLKQSYAQKKEKQENIIEGLEQAYKKRKHNLQVDYNEKILENDRISKQIEIEFIKNKKDKENVLKKNTRNYLSNALKLYKESVRTF